MENDINDEGTPDDTKNEADRKRRRSNLDDAEAGDDYDTWSDQEESLEAEQRIADDKEWKRRKKAN